MDDGRLFENGYLHEIDHMIMNPKPQVIFVLDDYIHRSTVISIVYLSNAGSLNVYYCAHSSRVQHNNKAFS